MLGCILVASPNFDADDSSVKTTDKVVLGYTAVITEVCLSGFASIYFEKIVKSTSEVITIWERNFQLSVYSIMMYSILIWGEDDTSRTQWANWSGLTFGVAALGAFGGITH